MAPNCSESRNAHLAASPRSSFRLAPVAVLRASSWCLLAVVWATRRNYTDIEIKKDKAEVLTPSRSLFIVANKNAHSCCIPSSNGTSVGKATGGGKIGGVFVAGTDS